MNPNLKTIFRSFSLSVLTVLLSVTVLYAATTIGENMTTAGTLNVTGASTLTGTLLVNNATSTINNLDMVNATSTNATSTTLAVTGNTNLATASSTGLVKVGSLRVGPNSTESPTVSGMVFGTCNFKSSVTLNALTDVASSTYVVCGDATGVLTGDKVFVQATSSLPVNTFIMAASSTAANTISLRIGVATSTGAQTVGLISINFWGVR